MSLRVSLAPRRLAVDTGARPLLNPAGAAVVLGAAPGVDGLAQPIVPRAETLFGPRGACLATATGPLFVADTGHHRLLVWRATPWQDQTPADLLIGQRDFGREGRNGKGEVGAATLNVPTGVAVEGDVLAVADAWNHRVLLWRGLPARANQPADLVLGQADFAGALANRGADRARGDTLNWCYGVTLSDGKLIVADTGNRRVLVWERLPDHNGASADLVLGQPDFSHRDENAGQAAGPGGMRWPHATLLVNGALLVADAGDNRVMGWRALPGRNGAPCDFVLGQRGAHLVDHNQAAYHPTARALSMPYGLALLPDRLIVADTANSRLVGFQLDELATGAAARFVSGQLGFGDKGDNRWSAATRDSLCWPYGVAAVAGTVVVADAGNNRVLLWEAAS